MRAGSEEDPDRNDYVPTSRYLSLPEKTPQDPETILPSFPGTYETFRRSVTSFASKEPTSLVRHSSRHTPEAHSGPGTCMGGNGKSPPKQSPRLDCIGRSESPRQKERRSKNYKELKGELPDYCSLFSFSFITQRTNQKVLRDSWTP